ncbi:MAG TPA: DhaKLM operon coactivator DhaQ, partial [Lactobacillus sp.]|nr:DhaKLM operon coactivator DhaQ [Lactobacillus sp.]
VELLQVEGLDLPFIKVGDFFTANGLAGISVTLLKLHEPWLEALNAPAKTYAWHQ